MSGYIFSVLTFVACLELAVGASIARDGPRDDTTLPQQQKDNPNNSFAVLGPLTTNVNGKFASKYSYIGLFRNPITAYNRNRMQYAIDNFIQKPTAISKPDRIISFKQPTFAENSVNLDFTIIGLPLTQQERDNIIKSIRVDANSQRAREDVQAERKKAAAGADAARRAEHPAGTYHGDDSSLVVGLIGKRKR